MSEYQPKHRHYNPKDLGVVRINGRDHYTGKWGTPGSREKYHRLLAEHAAGTLPVRPTRQEKADALTIDELIGRFTRHRVVDFYPAGKESEAANIAKALRWVSDRYGSTPAAEFGAREFKAVRAAMIPLNARTTINRDMGRIKLMFKWGVSESLYPANGLVALQSVEGIAAGRMGSREPKGVGPVPAADVAKTLPHLRPQVRAIVELMLHTAARPGEICRITPGEVDRSGPTWEYRPGRHKNKHRGAKRIILIGPKAQAVLSPWIEGPAGEPCFRPNRATVAPYSPGTLRKAVLRACRRADVPHWHPNQLRHTGATAIRKQFGLDAAQQVLGHARASTTERYAEPDLSRARDAMRENG